MKIYLADTIQRERLNYNMVFPIRHHLESFFAIIKNKANIEDWSIVDVDSDEEI